MNDDNETNQNLPESSSKEGQLISKQTTNSLELYKDEKLKALSAAGATPNELIQYYEGQAKAKNRYVAVATGFSLSAVMTLSGTALLIMGAPVLAGLSLLGIGAASAGAVFVIASGGEVTLEEFSKAAKISSSGGQNV